MKAKIIQILKFLALALLVSLVACTKGGDDDDDDDSSGPRTNACSVLGLNARIINGTECSTSNSPVVELEMVDTFGQVALCSGTMITKDDVLFAAHCLPAGPFSASADIN